MMKWIKGRKSFLLAGLRDAIIIIAFILAYHFLFAPQAQEPGGPETRLSYFELMTENYTCIEYNYEGVYWVLCLPDNVFMQPYIIKTQAGSPVIIEIER